MTSFIQFLRRNICVLVLGVLPSSCLSAAEPLPIPSSTFADQTADHRFDCDEYTGGFQIRWTGPTESGPPELQVLSARYNGREVKIDTEVNQIFGYFLYPETVTGECFSASNRIGIDVTAATKDNQFPRVLLYLDLTEVSLSVNDLICKRRDPSSTTSSFLEMKCRD